MVRRNRQRSGSGWYHAMNRGVDRASLYRDDRDRVEFGHAIAGAVERVPVEIHAYCLMGNHFHLLVRDRAGGVSSFMHHLGTTYVRRFNDRHGRDGPLFRSRFHSVAIESDLQLVRTLRYIHLNPIDVVGVEALDTYRWSSHRAYLGHRRAPSWLHVDRTRSMVGGIEGYRALLSAEPGGEAEPPTPSDVSVAVASAFGVSDLSTGSFAGVVRSVAIVLADRHRFGVEALTKDDRAVSRAERSRARSRLRNDVAFARLVADVERMLQLGAVPRCDGQALRSSPARSWAA